MVYQTEPVRAIKGVGPKAEELFQKLNIFTVENLLHHFPRDYDMFHPVQPISSMEEGKTVAIEVFLKERPLLKRFGGLKILSVLVADGSGQVSVTWFNMPFLLRQLKVGSRYLLRGRVVKKRGNLVLEQPKIYSKNEFYRLVGKMMPIYPLTSGLTNHAVQKAVEVALSETEDKREFLPSQLRKRAGLILWEKAIRQIHFPKNIEEYREARKRLVFDELFLYSLALAHLKEQGKQESRYKIKDCKETEEFISALPFELTMSQKKVCEEIDRDLCSGQVMNRLVQGDVGSGKTMVAVLALLRTVKNGYQGAFMAPTEVLAMQHYKKLSVQLEPFGIQTGLLTGSMTAKEKAVAREKIQNGDWDIVIGTHAVIQDKVAFQKLALVITDEQHRFGVKQRETLYHKGEEPHVLAMSATPIPRSLALVLYGDMDLSVMDELPAKRLPIKNCVVGTSYRPTAYKFIREEIQKGGQVYIICPMVEESENSDLENVTVYTEELKEILKEERIESLHGKMKPAVKNDIMERFSRGEIDILVSTTVIEVGIDVPNASVMLIENAERFGLAQLHQLRGRVGRGSRQSYCILMAGTENKEAMERLSIVAGSNDGFHIAAEDLKLRGQGDLFGVAQSGDRVFELADIYEDASVLKQAHEEAGQFSIEEIKKMLEKNERLRKKVDSYMGYVTI